MWDDDKRRRAVEERRARRDAIIDQVKHIVLSGRAAGISFRKIAAQLDSLGCRSPAPTGSSPWSGIAVKRIYDRLYVELPDDELRQYGIVRGPIGLGGLQRKTAG